MTKREYNKVKKHVADYIGKRVEYKCYWPSASKKGKFSGILEAIQDNYPDSLIVSWNRYTSVIHYSDVISITDIV